MMQVTSQFKAFRFRTAKDHRRCLKRNGGTMWRSQLAGMILQPC